MKDEDEGKLIIKTDITDWREEADELGFVPKNQKDMVDALAEGHTTAQVARASIVSRERGYADENILRPNKLLMQTGAMLQVGQAARNKRDVGQLPNGKTVNAPAYVGRVVHTAPTIPELGSDDEAQAQLFELEALAGGGDSGNVPPPDSDGPSYVDGGSYEAQRRAEQYLEDIVPGHIWDRLVIIARNGTAQDIETACVKLKYKINEMLDKLK